LQQDATHGQSVSVLPDKVFECRVSLRQLVFKCLIERIGEGALAGAKALRTFYFSLIPGNAMIGRSAFSGPGLLSLSLFENDLYVSESNTFCDGKTVRKAPIELARIPDYLLSGCTSVFLVSAQMIKVMSHAGMVGERDIDWSSHGPRVMVGLGRSRVAG
jgi:hypothetical protein